MFNWEDLRYFAAFAGAGSLSSAARKLGVDHATVARRISSLETSMGLKLVDRRHRSYVLTENGRKVAQLTEQITESACALWRYVGAEKDIVQGSVTVATLPAFAGTLIAPNIGSLYNAHPGLQLHLVVTKQTLSLSRHEADIAINLTRPVESSVVTRRVGTMRFAFYGSAEYLASGRETVFISYDETAVKTPHQAWLKQHTAGRPVTFSSNDLRIQAIAAAAHAGVALLPDYLAREYQLQPFETCGPALMQDIWLSVHEDVRDTKRIRVVLDFLMDCIGPAYSL